MAKDFLSLCLITKDSDKYIKEWVAFHLVVGFDKIIIFDNNQNSNLEVILANYLKSKRVTLIPFDGHQVQCYEHALKNYRDRTEWLAFLDDDEFIFSPTHTDLKKVIEKYGQNGGLVANWITFGTNGHIASPNGLVIEEYLDRGALDSLKCVPPQYAGIQGSDLLPINSHIKSIVRVEKTVSCLTPHHFAYVEGEYAVNSAGIRTDGPASFPLQLDVLRINHYWSKSWEDAEAKVNRGRADLGNKRTMEEATQRISAASGVRDEDILIYLAEVKEFMREMDSPAIL